MTNLYDSYEISKQAILRLYKLDNGTFFVCIIDDTADITWCDTVPTLPQATELFAFILAERGIEYGNTDKEYDRWRDDHDPKGAA